MGNPVVHFEIAGRDGERLETFYGKLFDWDIERRKTGGFPYGYITPGEGNLPGGIRHEPEGKAEVVLYVEVADLAAAVEEALQLGGGVRIPPMKAADVTFALITDPEGNPIGLVEKPGQAAE